jgi:hypothetical protein
VKGSGGENRVLRLLDSKTRLFCPSEANEARFQASLSSRFWRGTMPAPPSNGFFNPKALAGFFCLFSQKYEPILSF